MNGFRHWALMRRLSVVRFYNRRQHVDIRDRLWEAFLFSLAVAILVIPGLGMFGVFK